MEASFFIIGAMVVLVVFIGGTLLARYLHEKAEREVIKAIGERVRANLHRQHKE